MDGTTGADSDFAAWFALPLGLTTAATARPIVGSALRDAAVPEDSRIDILIVLTEAITTALRHHGPGATVTIGLRVEHGAATLLVDDIGRWPTDTTDPEERMSEAVITGLSHPATTTTGTGRTTLTARFPWPEQIPGPRNAP